MAPLAQATLLDRVAQLEAIIYAGNFQPGSIPNGFRPAVTVYALDGAIDFSAPWSLAMLTKGSAGAYTLAAPVAGSIAAGGDDGKYIEIVTESAFAHVVTSGTDGFNAKGSSGTATWTAAKGNSICLVARNGHWWQVGGLAGITLA